LIGLDESCKIEAEKSSGQIGSEFNETEHESEHERQTDFEQNQEELV